MDMRIRSMSCEAVMHPVVIPFLPAKGGNGMDYYYFMLMKYIGYKSIMNTIKVDEIIV